MNALAEMQHRTLREVDAWLGHARGGEEIVYSVGSLPRGSEAGRRLASLAASGAVLLFQRRIDATVQYVARRTSTPLPSAPALAGPDEAQDERDRLIGVIAVLAADDEACPTNAELAVLAGLPGAERASYRLRELVQRGLVKRHDTPFGRQLTVMATGATTAIIFNLPPGALRKGAGR